MQSMEQAQAGDLNEIRRPLTDHDVLRETYQRVKDMDARLEGLGKRVGAVERFMWMATGALFVIAAIVVPQWLELAGKNG